MAAPLICTSLVSLWSGRKGRSGNVLSLILAATFKWSVGILNVLLMELASLSTPVFTNHFLNIQFGFWPKWWLLFIDCMSLMSRTGNENFSFFFFQCLNMSTLKKLYRNWNAQQHNQSVFVRSFLINIIKNWGALWERNRA